MFHKFSHVFLRLSYRLMRTYENTKIYKVVNDVDDVIFFGYTSMSLPSRLASLKKESCNLSCSGTVYDHMRTLGKEHFKLMLVETFPCKNKDEVTAKIASLMAEDVKPDDGSTELEAKVERLERLIQQHLSNNNDKCVMSCETDRLHQELEQQRTLITCLQKMVQQLSETVLQLQPSRSIPLDVDVDVETKVIAMSERASSEVLHGGSSLGARPSPVPLDVIPVPETTVRDPAEPPSSQTPEHFHISDGDVEEERPKCIPQYDLTDDLFKILKGKVDEEHIDILRDRYVRAVRLGKHVHLHPRDESSKDEHMYVKESFAMKLAGLRVDANDIGLDRSCLKLLDTIEKDAGIGNNLRKKAAWYAADFRKRYSFDEYD